ncbi:MAG: ribbon-helix-helix domain-containing protein [Bacillota bacterium]|nr:ribbon-helix-helix domain-containing protein [Bacillota bacterium]
MSETSWQVKKKYNDRVYKRISVALDKDLVEEWEKRLKAEGMGKSEFIRRAIKNYLDK